MVVLILTTFLVCLTKHFANQGEQKSNVDFNTHYTMFSWDIFQWLIKVFRFGCAVYIHSIWFGLEDLELMFFSYLWVQRREGGECESWKKGVWKEGLLATGVTDMADQASEQQELFEQNLGNLAPPELRRVPTTAVGHQTLASQTSYVQFFFFSFFFVRISAPPKLNTCGDHCWCFQCCQLVRLNPPRRAFCTKCPSFGSWPEKWSF